MIKKITSVYIICFVFNLGIFCQINKAKNIFGFSFGFSPGKKSGFYVGGDVDTWPDKKFSPVVNLFYARQVSETFRIGSYFEYENSKFDIRYLEDQKASRYNIGINWLGQYPKTKLHIQLGGYFGGGFVNSKMDGWEKALWGFDLGIIAGPAYEFRNMGFALQGHTGLGAYQGSSQPNVVILMLPKILFKVYYKL
jgi:hypothetical protein